MSLFEKNGSALPQRRRAWLAPSAQTSTGSGAGSSAGSSTAQAVAPFGTATAAGSSTATGGGAALASGAGSSAGTSTAVATSSAVFPLTVSSNGRYLQQANGAPFLICADTTWSLFVDIPLASINSFLTDITGKGFNAVMGNVVEHHYTLVKPPKERGGALPFTTRLDGTSYTGTPNGTNGAAGTQGQFAGDPYSNIANQSPDWTFPNTTYWIALESILDACLQQNVAVFVWAAYLGFQANDEGWLNEMVALDAVTGAGGFVGQPFADNTKPRTWNYGAWLADRWKHYPHLIWTMGGDYGTNTNALTTAQRSAVNNVMAGLKSVAGQQSTLFTAHWDRPCVSTDVTLTAGAWDLNLAYCGEEVAQTTRLGYAAVPAIPSFLGEYFYEGSLFGGSAPFRKYTYWGMLSGIAGGFFGHEQLWRFDDGTPGTDWTTLLSTQSTLDASRAFAFLKSRPWHRLKPSGLGGMGTLITAGGGTASPQTTNYVAAACTPEGDLLVAYVPPAHTGSVTVDMTKLAAPAVAKWFDPANASFTAIGTIANTGTHAFTPPATNSAGDTDFLLVLEVNSGAGSSAGSSTAVGVGAALASGAGSSAGSAAATAAGSAIAAGTGSAAGTSTATGGGAALAAATGSSAGTSTAQAFSGSAAGGAGAAAGFSTAAAVGAALAAGTGTSDGASTAEAVGQVGPTGSTGSVAGSSTALGGGAALASAAGSAAGTSTAVAVGPDAAPGHVRITGTAPDPEVYAGTVPAAEVYDGAV